MNEETPQDPNTDGSTTDDTQGYTDPTATTDPPPTGGGGTGGGITGSTDTTKAMPDTDPPPTGGGGTGGGV